MHVLADIQRITLNALSLVMHNKLGRKNRTTKQMQVFCHVTRFTSDFLSFIVVEHIRYFHGALQMCFDLIVCVHG